MCYRDIDGHDEESRRNVEYAVVTSSSLLRTVTGKVSQTKQLNLILKCRDLVFGMMQWLEKISKSVAEANPEVHNTDVLERLNGEHLQKSFSFIDEWLVRKTLVRPREVKALKDDLKVPLLIKRHFLMSIVDL